MAAKSTNNKHELNARQRAFIEEYLIDLNATQAYIRAGYSARGNAAEVSAAKLLRHPQVSKRIEERKNELQVRTEVTQERVLKELSRLAFFDIGKAFTEEGTLRPIHEIDEDTRRALMGLDVLQVTEDGQLVGTMKKVKLANKIDAIDKLMKHLGMFSPVRVKFDDPLSVLVKQVQGSSFKPTGQTQQSSEQSVTASAESVAERALREAATTGASFMSIFPGAAMEDDDG
ncbi:terminase small subunit [Methylosinus sp. PW1]|uniref:terminase small subunit n=1 Tax=Methylosinus sp. PW1 TaxID=107636 RepID=UPI00068C90B3|nr:terminase small subunit [Methylosinus sp. PW1]